MSNAEGAHRSAKPRFTILLRKKYITQHRKNIAPSW